MKNILLKPRVSEKAYGLSQSGNVYVFTVPTTANKHTVSQAVAAQFNVTVEAVNILVQKGKTVRSYRKRSRAVTGSRADSKKAYVTLKEGDNIAVFESDEAKTDKKADKKARKSAKESK